jgi:hypothetical protein
VVERLPPNRRVQSTPLRGRKIVAFLKVGFPPKAFSIYWCGAADAQAVGPHLISREMLHKQHALV